MNLLELLDTKTKVSITRRPGLRWVASSVIGGRKIMFVAERNRNYSETADRWEIDFYEIDSDGDSVQHVTGSGEEFKVGAMIKSSMINFLREVNPKVFSFESALETRSKIYKRVVDRIASDRYEPLTHDSPQGERFVYTRRPQI